MLGRYTPANRSSPAIRWWIFAANSDRKPQNYEITVRQMPSCVIRWVGSEKRPPKSWFPWEQAKFLAEEDLWIPVYRGSY